MIGLLTVLRNELLRVGLSSCGKVAVANLESE